MPAGLRYLHGVENRRIRGHLVIALVIVKIHFAIFERGYLSGIADIGDQHNARMLGILRPGGSHNFQLAKITAESFLICFAQILTREDHDDIFEPGPLESDHGFGIELLAQINTADPGTQRVTQRRDLKRQHIGNQGNHRHLRPPVLTPSYAARSLGPRLLQQESHAARFYAASG